MAHGVIEGMPQFKMAELGEQEIPTVVINRFDYVAMGHYHNCLQVGPRAWHAGSTERLSQAERLSPKGFLEVCFEPFEVKFHEVTCREMIDVPVINAEGLRGDQILDLIESRLELNNFEGKLARITIDGVSEEAIRTLPRERLSALKERAFDLNVRINREQSAGLPEVGREAAGRLNQGFVEFLKTADLKGMNLGRLAQMADRYLTGQD